MFLHLDTETTGLPDYNKPLTDPCQPHIVQLAVILTDGADREMSCLKLPIKPEGWSVDENDGASKVHGLTQKDLEKYGVPIAQALRAFREMADRAELKVAYNYRFDGFLLKCEHERAGIDPGPLKERFCTMKAMKEIRGKSGRLTEVYGEVVGHGFDNAHDSLADCRASKEIFTYIRKNGLFRPQPRFEAPR